MSLAAAAAVIVGVAAAFLLGGMPTGYALARRLRGVDIRRLSPHNLGLGTVISLVGLPVLLVVVALDLAKGALAVGVARSLTSADWGLAAASAAAIAGHAWAPVRFGAPRVASRLKGLSVGLGTLLALVVSGALRPAAVVVPLVVAGAALLLPRAMGPRWGYLSAAAVLGAVSLPPAVWGGGAAGPYLVLSVGYALLTLWNHKEHLLRIVDGVEPRLGERLPVPGLDGEAVCAFLIHPMSLEDAWEARRFRPLAPLHRRGVITDRTFRRLARWTRPMKVDDWHPIMTADGRRARVYLIGAPLLPDQIRGDPALATRRAVQAADLAANLGATVLGLGAFWSVVGNKGLEVQKRSPIAITNGGAYTAGTVRMAVPLVLERLRARGADATGATAAVVGANGVVGFGICRALVGRIGRLIMVGTDQARLERSRDLLQRRHPEATLEVATHLGLLREAHVVFAATSDPRPVIFAEHVRPGTLLFDLGRPPDVDESVRAVPGVEVIPGGVVRLPGDPRGRIDDLGYGPGLVPACLAETIIIALDGCHDRASLGERTSSEDIDYFVRRAAEMGFEVIGAIKQTEVTA